MEIEKEIQQIRERNGRVEMDKAWETSSVRRLFIAAITYASAFIFLLLIDVQAPYLAAIVPTGGYILSTLSLPYVRRMWERGKS